MSGHLRLPRAPSSRRLAAALAVFLTALPVAWLAAAGAADAAQEGGEAVPGAAPAPAVPNPPSRAELGQRYARLIDDAAAARRRLGDLSDVDALATDAERLADDGDALSGRLESLASEPRSGLDELLTLRSALADHRQRLTDLGDRLAGRLTALDEERRSWQERRDLWLAWRRDLAQRGELQGFRDDFTRALEAIDGVLVAGEEAVPRLAPVQSELARLQERLLGLEQRLDDTLETKRSRLLHRDAPPLLGSEHRSVSAAAWGGLAPPTPAAAGLDAADLLRRYGALLLVTLLVLLASAALARWSRHRYPSSDERWRILLSRPWSIGVFVAFAVTLPLYRSPPPLVRLALLSVLAVATCVLTRGMFRNRRKRRVVYALAALFVLLRALDAFSFPHPLLRLVLAAVALAGEPYLLLLARREVRAAGRRTVFALSLVATAAAFALVLAAQLLGYDSLSRWLLEGALATAFVVFVNIFLLRLGRGAIRATLRRTPRGRLRLLRRVGFELSERLVTLLELLLVGGAAVYVLTVWGVFETPTQAWQVVAGSGFSLGGHRITVAQLLLAAAVVYAALVASGVLRTLLDDELAERRHLAPGLADSAKTLLHYSLIVVGVTFALVLVGFDLSTFALVAGALGVGIGFGLQNIVNNFVSGLILLFERPVRVGDVVMLDGEWATIRKIGLRSTVVQSFEMAEIIVPNSDLISQKVVNWTLSDSTTRLLLQVGVAYGSDLETVFRILAEVVAEHPLVVAEPEPRVHFVGFGASSLDFEIRAWVAEVGHRLDARSELLREIDRRFRGAGVEIPFPQRDLHLRTVDAAQGGLADRAGEGGEVGDGGEDGAAGADPPTPSR